MGGAATEKKGKTKRQHYVPQMILRNFSQNRATTSVLVLSSGKRVPDAPINRQAYEPYFYGEDQVMEESFAREEGKVASILGDLSRDRLDALCDTDIGALKMFIHYQHARTLGAAQSMSNFAAAFAESALRGTAHLNNDDELREALEHVKISMTGAQHERLWLASKSTPIIYDLEARFLVTERAEGFLVGDHPVVAYNQFAEHHPLFSHYEATTGIALKGLQLFMPLSPGVTLAFFDPSTYEYDGRRVCGVGPRDVRFLNAAQAVNSWECVFFDPSRTDDVALERALAARRKHPSVFDKPVATSDMIKRDDGAISQYVVVTHPDVRVGARFSFLRTTDKHSYAGYEGPTVPIRSQDLVRFTELYGQHLEDEVKRGRMGRGLPVEEEQADA